MPRFWVLFSVVWDYTRGTARETKARESENYGKSISKLLFDHSWARSVLEM